MERPKGRTSPCGTQADVYFNEAFKNSLEDAIITDFSCIILLQVTLEHALGISALPNWSAEISEKYCNFIASRQLSDHRR